MQGDRVVVVGAGVGGLVTAALLAARGLSVTLVEAEAGPGGKLRAIGGIDAGPTVFTLRHVFEEIFAECGARIDDHLTTAPAHLLARHAWGEDRLDLFADPDESEAAIGDFAGAADARGYRAFRAEAERIFRTLDAPFLRDTRTNPIGLTWRLGLSGFRDLNAIRPYESLWRALGSHFADPRLRQLFGRYATYCGSSPFKAPATLMLIAHVEAAGVWLVEGGMAALAKALETLGRGMGVQPRYGARVARIETARGRVSGVVLANGETIPADAVVVNADPAHLGAGRFGVRAGTRVPPAARSLSALVWLSETPAAGFPLVRHNVFFSSDYRAEFAAISDGRLPADPTVYVCAQDRDDRGMHAGGDSTDRVQIIVNAPPTADTRPLTEQEIATCTQAMHARLAASGLRLDLPAPTTRLLTPADFESLNPSTGGALYGRASHGWAASFLRQGSRTRIPGLYCAGGSTHPGAGVPMAALSGRLAAACLLKDRASTSVSMRRAMPGGISTRSATTAATG